MTDDTPQDTTDRDRPPETDPDGGQSATDNGPPSAPATDDSSRLETLETVSVVLGGCLFGLFMVYLLLLSVDVEPVELSNAQEFGLLFTTAVWFTLFVLLREHHSEQSA